MIMRRMILGLCLMGTVVASQAQESLLVKANLNAKVFAQKMDAMLQLKEAQKKEVYRLRFELALAVNLAVKKFEGNPEKLDKKLFKVQENFQAGMKRALKNTQVEAWTAYKEEHLINEWGERTQIADFDF